MGLFWPRPDVARPCRLGVAIWIRGEAGPVRAVGRAVLLVVSGNSICFDLQGFATGPGTACDRKKLHLAQGAGVCNIVTGSFSTSFENFSRLLILKDVKGMQGSDEPHSIFRTLRGAYYCRDCRDAQGRYTSKLNVDKKCFACGKSWRKNPKYIGRIFHDFRRSAAHEAWKAGSSVEDCMKITGHKTASMFKRYADLFSDEEKRAQQLAVQSKRREWKKAQAGNVVVAPRRAALQ